jgi:RecA-family ATPase
MTSLDLSMPVFEELAALTRWVGWRWETRNGKATKPPIAASGGYANTTDPGTWTNLIGALDAVHQHGLEGPGFVLDAAKDGIVGIDLDGCRDPETGELTRWARKIIGLINSYAEISPSGSGVKLLCKADPVPKLRANKRTLGQVNGAKTPAIEVYTTARYFCITGQHVEGTPDEIVDATEALERLATWIAKAKPEPGKERTQASGELPSAFLDLLERDAALRRAWETGEKIGPGSDTSASGLEFSLARHLRRHLDDVDLETTLQLYPHGQIASGKLKGDAAERRIRRILDDVGPRPEPPPPPPKVDLALEDADRVAWPRYVLMPPTPPAFLVQDIVPLHAVTGLFGLDGLGKTLVAQQALTAVSAGKDVFGHQVLTPCPTLGWFCEESTEILAYRQDAINGRMGLRFGDLDRIGLELRGRVGLDNLLLRMRDGVCEPTPTYEALANYCVARAIRLLWLDHILHIVAGDITRAEEVSKMLALLSGLARRIDGAVVIAGHVAKAEGSQFLGSIMFSALVRSRLWLRRPTADEARLQMGVDAKNLRVLELAKANHAGLTQMTLEWSNGAFAWLGDAGAQEAQRDRERQAEAAFIRALRELDQREQAVSTHGHTSAPRIMHEFGLDEGCSAEELQAAMRRLIQAKRIKASVPKPWLRSNRHPAKGLALSEDCQ